MFYKNRTGSQKRGLKLPKGSRISFVFFLRFTWC